MTSSYAQLLVHFDDTPRAALRLALARRLAAEQGAAVAALYATRAAYEMALVAPDVPAVVIQELTRMDEERLAAARRRFETAMTEPGPPATWARVKDAAVEFAFAQQALYADLLVMGQRDAGDPTAQEVPPDLVSSTVVSSGKPALVLPYAPEAPDRFATIVIAWKPTREAARAVCGAMPLLQRASQVLVLSWGEEEQFATGSLLDLRRFLAAHGIQAQFHPQGAKETPRIGEMILSRTCDLSADLLVMGCYGHSRGREWLLGGATRTVLESMTLPVLMAH